MNVIPAHSVAGGSAESRREPASWEEEVLRGRASDVQPLQVLMEGPAYLCSLLQDRLNLHDVPVEKVEEVLSQSFNFVDDCLGEESSSVI